MMKQNHEVSKVPEGYKQTEVGIIPDDWFFSKIGSLLTIKHGRSQKDVEVENGNYPILGTGGLIGKAKRYLYDKPSVLIGRKGTINRPVYMEIPFWTVDTLFYSEVHENNSAKFLYYKFCMIDWMQYNEASGVPSLNAGTIEQVIISFPLLEEQTAIANALSDVDALIAELERLIAKKEAIKTGAMQQLLTGRTRLPQFSKREDGTPKGYKTSELGEIPEDWRGVSISDIAEISMGQSPNSSNYNKSGEGLPLVQGNADIYKRETIIRNYTSEITKRADLGDLILSVRAPVGEVAIASFDCCIGRGVCSLKYPNNYLYHWLVFFEDKWEQFSKGSTFDSINSEDLKKIELIIPNSNEQTAIAEILSDMDSEIEALEKRLDKTKALKQGMMQELLTGRTRLV